MQEFLGYLLPGLMVGCVYALISLGFVTIYRTTSVLNLAQGEFFLLGAYAVILTVSQLGLPFWLGIPVSLALLALLGLLTERFALRPLTGQPLVGIILMTLGLAVFLRAVMILVWTDMPRPVPSPFGAGGIVVMGVNVPQAYLWSAIVSVSLFIALMLFFNRTKTGLMMKATADATQLAQSCGVSVSRVTAAAWIIAAIVTGVGGFLLCSISGVSPTMSFLGLKAIAVVLAGGMESFGGTMIAGVIIGAIEFVGAGYFDEFVGGGLKEVIAFAVLIIFILFRPYGLFGWKTIERL